MVAQDYISVWHQGDHIRGFAEVLLSWARESFLQDIQSLRLLILQGPTKLQPFFDRDSDKSMQLNDWVRTPRRSK